MITVSVTLALLYVYGNEAMLKHTYGTKHTYINKNILTHLEYANASQYSLTTGAKI